MLVPVVSTQPVPLFSPMRNLPELNAQSCLWRFARSDLHHSIRSSKASNAVPAGRAIFLSASADGAIARFCGSRERGFASRRRLKSAGRAPVLFNFRARRLQPIRVKTGAAGDGRVPQGRSGIGSCRRALDQGRLRRRARIVKRGMLPYQKRGREIRRKTSVCEHSNSQPAEGNVPVASWTFCKCTIASLLDRQPAAP
jgi:hypothetical protein